MLRTTLMAALCALLCLSGNAFAQTDIDVIQNYDDLGAPASPSVGLSETVRGVITCEEGTYNSGTHYLQDPTGGMSFFLSGTGLVFGDSVEVTGTVSAFGGEIQLSSPSITVLGFSTVPAPLVLTVSEAVDFDGSGTQTGGDYEIVGSLIEVTGNVAFLPGQEAPPWPLNGAQGLFGLTDASGDTLTVFVDRTTLIDPTVLGEGDLFQVTAPMANFNGLLEMKPRFDPDLVKNPGDPFPSITNITPAPWSPDANQAVTITATIVDASGLQSTTLYYAYGGSGSFSSVAMINTFGDFYEATIPGTTEATIEYYVEATDNSAQTSTVPGDAPVSTLGLAVGLTSIYDIQSDQDGTGGSNYVGQTVNIEAIVTLAPGELNAPNSQWIVEDEMGGPYSAIFVFEGSGGNVLFRGDKVRISGLIAELNGGTEILPQRADAVTLISFGNPEPPIDVLTSSFADTVDAYEFVMVRTFMSTVQDTIPASDNFTVIDATSDSVLTIDPLFAVTLAPEPDDTAILVGMLDTRFGVNEVSPRDDLDFQLFATDVENQVPNRKGAQLSSIHPNPFNPRTRIEFELPRRGMSELAIFNAKGEKVAVLANGELDGGPHFRTWSGLDQAGQAVSSGVYYVRLRFETESVSVQKATLLK